MTEATVIRLETSSTGVRDTPTETGEVIKLFGARTVLQVPEELVLSNNALTEKHLSQVQRLFDAALNTCEKSTKDLALSKEARCVLTRNALLEMIECVFEQSKNCSA